jgi:hypothetical protein
VSLASYATTKADKNFSKTYIVYLMTAVKDKSTFMEGMPPGNYMLHIPDSFLRDSLLL